MVVGCSVSSHLRAEQQNIVRDVLLYVTFSIVNIHMCYVCLRSTKPF